MLNSFRKLFSNSPNRKARRAYSRPQLLQLEGRIVPATFTVLNTNDSGADSLRDAIDKANNESLNPGADTIVFAANLTTSAPATINLSTSGDNTSGASAFGITSAITITGPTGANGITLNNTLVNQRLFYVSSAGNLTLDSLTLSGGKAQGNGGGILNNGGTLNITNSTISGNTAFSGGGILGLQGTLTINNSTISGNTATTTDGGGIKSYGTLTVNNSTISGNTAGTSGFGGGGICNFGGTLSVTNSTISGNTAGNQGGGITNFFGTATVTNSTLSGNTATTGKGGGILNSNNSTLTLTNSTLSGNTATSGGGIYNSPYRPAQQMGSFTEPSRPAGILNIANTIIANSTIGGDYAGGGTVNLINGATAANNIVTLGSFQLWATTVSVLNLGPLTNNGGPTETIALTGLTTASVKTGGNASISNNPIYANGLDQRGVTRSSTAPSIGAYEFVATAPPTPPAPPAPPTPTPTPTPTPPTPTAPLITGTPTPPSSTGSSTVNLYNAATGEPTGTAVPFPGFNGAVKVVSGDFDGDGVAELIAGAGFGGGPAIAILNSQTGEVMESFFAFDPAFTGGVFVAVQDTNGDGILDIIASAGPGGGPEVRIFNGANLNVLRSFFAYAEDFTGGVSVASIDFNNDGILDLVTGAGPGGAPHVKVFDGATNSIISQWYAYPVSFTGGVFVAVGDIGNNGTFEVVTGAGLGGAPVVAVWDPFTGALLAQFMAYAEDFTGGVRVGVNDGNGDGTADIITGAGPGGGPHVKAFSFPALDLLFEFYSGEETNPGGVFVS